MRKAYLDNIRWSVILLVLVYHVCYIFNGVKIPGGIPNADNIPAFDAFACLVYPWFMVLLFVIAGMSAAYSLEKRTVRQFIRERSLKLLVPSTLGLLLIHWITGYINIKMSGGLDYIPESLIYPISALSGIGPLWFVQTLFLFSCIIAAIKKFGKSDSLRKMCSTAKTPVILLLFIPIWGASQILNMPLLTVYRFGIYFTAFLIGYFIFSNSKVQDRIENICIPMTVLGTACAAAYTVYYYGKDYTAPECLHSLFTNFYLWISVIAIIGLSKKYFNRETKFTRYMTSAGYGIYILHYSVLTVSCYILHYYCSFPAIINYIIALVSEFIITFALYEILKRVPVIRFLVLGLTAKKQQIN